MEYKRFENTIIVRMDRGEDILEQLRIVSEKENVKLASVSALGATDKFTVGVFKPSEKKYYQNEFCGDFEILSLTGTVTQMNGEYYAHIHMSAGDDTGRVFGGHLNAAHISVTCEMVITVIDGTVERVFDEDVGINRMVF